MFHQNDAIILSVLNKYAGATKMVDNDRNLPFHFACGWYPVLKSNTLHMLLNSFPESAAKTTSNNSLPIHLYVEAKLKGNEELLFLTHLIHQVRNCLKFADNKGQYPLHIACQYCGDWNVIHLLLIFGPEAVNKTDNDGNCPIHYALKHDPMMPSNVIEQMVQINPMMIIEPARNKEGIPEFLPMFYALRDHTDSTICALVECYLQCLQQPTDPKERLPLHLACIYRKSTIFLYFIEKYAKAAQKHDNNLKLPIHYASANLSITPETIQQLMLTWPESSFQFCPNKKESNDNNDDNMFEQDINDFDNNWH